MSLIKILAVSESDDRHVNIIEDACKRRSILFNRLNTDTVTQIPNATWRLCPNDKQRTKNNSWHTDDVSVIWYRRRLHIPEKFDHIRSFCFQETEGLIESLLHQYTSCRWVSRPESIVSARSKPNQLITAARYGLDIPRTLITKDLDVLKSFASECANGIVAKPIQTQVLNSEKSSRVLGTRTLKSLNFGQATKFTPCFAQEKLEIKYEVRVVMFGSKAYAFRLIPQSQVDDLKQLTLDKIKHEVCSIDKKTTAALIALMKHFRLEFSAVDFAVTKNDTLVFLELNPNGQWLWLQYMTNFDLTNPFIDFLCL